MLANTKQVRKLVNSLNVRDKDVSWKTNNWTNKSAKADIRNLCFVVKWEHGETVLQKVNEALFLAGFTNKTKVTYSGDKGVYYLRINASYTD